MYGDCGILVVMEIDQPAGNTPESTPENPTGERNLIVVEACNYCRCHTLVRARVQTDESRWFLFFLPVRFGVTFGDRLIFLPGYGDNPALFLDRGPKLRYRLDMEPLPTDVAAKAKSDLPWELHF